jgi:hypothetical protein
MLSKSTVKDKRRLVRRSEGDKEARRWRVCAFCGWELYALVEDKKGREDRTSLPFLLELSY